MKIITNDRICDVLNDIYSMSSIGNTKAVLFISEFDDHVEGRINLWLSAYESIIADEINSNISDISEKEIVHIHYDCGFDTDEEYRWRHNERLALHNLIKKDNQLKLIIISMLSPLWTNNASIFSNEDVFFDEIISVQLDKQVYKIEFDSEIDEMIVELQNIKKARYENDIKALHAEKRLGDYILNHPGFDFVPITLIGNETDRCGRLKTEHFSPVEFWNFIYDSDGDLGKALESLKKGSDFSPKVKQMLLDILRS